MPASLSSATNSSLSTRDKLSPRPSFNGSLPSLILAQSALMIADHETHSMVRARPVGRRSDLAAILAEAQQALEINFEDGFTLSSCDDDFSIASFGSDTDFPDKVTANALRASIVFELKKAEESSSLPKRRQRQRMTDVFENDSLHLKHSNRVRRIAPITSVEPKSEAPAGLKGTRQQTRPTDGLEINFEDGFTLSSCDDDFSIASFGSYQESDTNFPDKVTANALRASIVFELKKAEESSSLPKRRQRQRQRQRMTDVFENDSLHLKHSNRVRRIAPITSVEPKSEAPAVLKRTRRQTRPTDGLEDGFEKDSLHLKQTRRVPRRKCRNHDVEVLVEPDLEFSGEVFEIPLKY